MMLFHRLTFDKKYIVLKGEPRFKSVVVPFIVWDERAFKAQEKSSFSLFLEKISWRERTLTCLKKKQLFSWHEHTLRVLHTAYTWLRVQFFLLATKKCRSFNR